MGSDKDATSRRSVASSKGNEDGGMERGAWGGQLEFILTCIGFAVGLGNVWRFPYLLYKSGGGAFLIPFVIMLFIIGIPLFFLELNFGQFASLGPLTIWNISPIMKGLGFAMVFTNLCVALYYNVIISWCLYYVFASMTDVLPWVDCDNYWNTEYCYTTAEFANLTGENITEVWINNVSVPRAELKSPSEEYYYNKVLQMSEDVGDSGTIVWQLALCLLLCWAIVFFVLIKGIGSLGKVVYFTSIFPYVLLTIMLIRGVTLEGAQLGIEFYLIPDWDKLTDPKVWSDAATQIFYALSTCTGGLIAMASYNNFNNNTLRDSLIVPIVNVLTSFYAGFVIFSVLGYMATVKGVPVADVAADGPGLVFVVYPEGLATMPIAPLWSILFFIMMMILGLSSMFSMVECFFSAFMDEYPGLLRKSYWHTAIFRALGCLCFYLISLPMVTNGGFYIFTLFDTYTGNFPLLIVGLLELITICYIYDTANDKLDRLLKAFESLDDRMTRLERVQQTSGNQPRNESHPRQQSRPRPTGSGPKRQQSTTDRSNNPEFATMAKSLYKVVQLEHQMGHWEEDLPLSLQRQFSNLINIIKPADPTKEIKEEISSTLKRAGKEIRTSVWAHLRDRQMNHLRSLRQCNPEDKERAKDMALGWLTERLGKKIPAETLKGKLDEAFRSIQQQQQPIPNSPQPGTSRDFITPSNPTKKRKVVTPSPLLETSNRFDVLTPAAAAIDEDGDDEGTDGETHLQPISSTNLKTPKRVNTHGGQAKNFWSIKLRPDTETLIISDSNLKLVSESDVPEKCQLEVFSGAKLDHLAKLIEELAPNPPKRIISSVGINHRTHAESSIIKHARSVRLAVENCTAEFFAMGVSLPPSLAATEQQMIQSVNQKLLMDHGNHFIVPLLPDDVRTGPDGIHYTDETTKKVWNKILSVINQKN